MELLDAFMAKRMMIRYVSECWSVSGEHGAPNPTRLTVFQVSMPPPFKGTHHYLDRVI
jgi:hypothetical protein